MVDTDTPIWYEVVAAHSGDHRTIQENLEIEETIQGDIKKARAARKPRKRTSPPVPAITQTSDYAPFT